MASYLIAAYVIFCAVPLGLAWSIHFRRRKLSRKGKR